MAATYSATTFFLLPPATAAPFPRKTLVRISSSSTSISSPIKPKRQRKNYLRPKILKTLPKPHPTTSPLPPLPDPPSPLPLEPQECPSDQFSGQELTESEVPAGDLSDRLGNFDKIPVLKIGLYLVGAFLFQTVCTVWVLGSVDYDHKDGILDDEDSKTRVSELGVNGNSDAQSNVLVNVRGNRGIVCFDETELGKKIIEIQAMAREVREKERMELKADKEGVGDDDFGVAKTGIEKEVDRRLVKLRKSLQNSHEKTSVGYLSKDRVGKDSLDVKEANGALMYRKKYKFRSPSSVSTSDRPKGFQGSDDHSRSQMKNISAVPGDEILERTSDGNYVLDLLDNEKRLDLPNGKIHDPLTSKDDGGRKAPVEEIEYTNTRKKLGEGKERAKLGKAEPVNGNPQDVTYGGMPPGKDVKLGGSSRMDEPSAPKLTYDQDSSKIANKDDLLSRGGSLTGRKVGEKESTKGVWNEKSNSPSDSWWLALPYVLAVLMHTGRYDEGSRGIYTIKSTSHNEDGSSHVVAFEDCGDATNFCYLLQSSFEELEDFSTDIFPIPIKDLDEAVRSHLMKVLVVRKGQLRLYAGQPLSDVEMALRSMVVQS